MGIPYDSVFQKEHTVEDRTMNIIIIAIALLHLTTYVYSQGQVKVINKCNAPLLIRTEAGSWTSKVLNAGQEASVTFPFGNAKPRVWALRGCTGSDENSCLDFHRYQTRQFNSLAEFNWTPTGQLW